ncbi:MAG: hypothetical protein IJV55_05280 [Paludibacteraceae bacterium]|nr:hypothetical protein [Paludibacteraceae bacterium]
MMQELPCRRLGRACMLLLAVFVSLYTHAQQAHYVALRTEAAFASLTDNVPSTAFASGVGVGIGADWMFRHKQFLFSAGIMLSPSFTFTPVADAREDLPAMDTEGEQFLYHVELSRRRDAVYRLEASVPLMVGAQFGKFYFMAGPQLSLPLLSVGTVDALLNTSGIYERAAQPFEGMDNHAFLQDYESRTVNQSVPLLPGISARIEIGGEITPVTRETGYDVLHPRHRCYLAFFATYGFLNRHTNVSKGAVFSQENQQGIQMKINHIYTSDAALGCRLTDLTVGLRFTVLFPLPQKKECVICNE